MSYKSIAAGLLILVAAAPHQQGKSQRGHQHRDASALTLSPPDRTDDAKSASDQCSNTSKPEIACDQISAQAAIDQVHYADRQTNISLFAAVTGLVTLFAAAFAAWYAREAATHNAKGAIESQRSADIAQEGLVEAKRIGQAQVRAYLSLSEPEITFLEDSTITLTCKVRNTGQSPALHLKCQYLVDLSLTGQEPKQQIAGDLIHNKRVDISSGETFSIPKQRLTEGLSPEVVNW